jgi:hypothetical protein
MADVATDGMDAEHAASLGRRYLIRFEEDTLRPRPLWIQLPAANYRGRNQSCPCGSGRKWKSATRPRQPPRPPGQDSGKVRKGALFSAFPRDHQGACGTRGRRFLMGSP